MNEVKVEKSVIDEKLKIGQYWEYVPRGEIYLLTKVEEERYCLINTKSGNRFSIGCPVHNIDDVFHGCKHEFKQLQKGSVITITIRY